MARLFNWETTVKLGFINKQGKLAVNPRFDAAEDFSEGLERAKLGAFLSAKWGYIDKQGKVSVNPQFGFATGFRDGRDTALRVDVGKVGYMAR